MQQMLQSYLEGANEVDAELRTCVQYPKCWPGEAIFRQSRK